MNEDECNEYRIRWKYLDIIGWEHRDLAHAIEAFARFFNPSPTQPNAMQLLQIKEYEALIQALAKHKKRENYEDEASERFYRQQTLLNIDNRQLALQTGVRFLWYILMQEKSRHDACLKATGKLYSQYLIDNDASLRAGKISQHKVDRIRAMIRLDNQNCDTEYQNIVDTERRTHLQLVEKEANQHLSRSNFRGDAAVAGKGFTFAPAHVCQCNLKK